jgi:hypothetical protein
MYKGCTRDTQGINRLAILEQYRSNTAAPRRNRAQATLAAGAVPAVSSGTRQCSANVAFDAVQELVTTSGRPFTGDQAAESPALAVDLFRPIFWLSCNHIEQSAFVCVKGVMNRIRVMLGSLLPALWLLATGHSFLDSISEYAGDRHVASIFATRQGNRLPIQGSCSFEQSARCWSRRVWVHSGPNGFPPFLSASDWALPGLLQVDVALTLSDGPLGLAKCWQFHWRTALGPRAPSSVS